MKLITLERLGTFWAAIKSYLSNNKYMKLVASATEPSDHSVCWINTNNGLIYIYNSNTASWCSRVSTCATADNANYVNSKSIDDYLPLAGGNMTGAICLPDGKSEMDYKSGKYNYGFFVNDDEQCCGIHDWNGGGEVMRYYHATHEFAVTCNNGLKLASGVILK